MIKTIVRLIFRYLLTIWLAVTALFVLLVLIRGNPIGMYVDTRLTPERQANLKRIYGYDRPAIVQYGHYLRNLGRGELGLSFTYKEPVARLLLQRLGNTIWLGTFTYLLGFVLCAFLVYGLSRPGWMARLCGVLHSVSLSVPSFLLATLFIAVLGVRLKLLPLYGSRSLFADETHAFLDLLRHSLMPAFSMAIPLAGQLAAWFQEHVRQLDEAPFVLAARGRGVPERRIFFNHKLRTILPGVIQVAGLYLPMIVGGALAMEALFGQAGIGLLLFDAALARDYPLLLGGCILTALLVIPGYELADWFRDRLEPWREA